MLEQERMIARVRQLCVEDERIAAALQYGGWTRGEGDRFSDIEFVLFFQETALPELDREAWVRRIAPVEIFFADEFGHYTAIFENLVRGEFHFEPASRIPWIAAWRGYTWYPSLESALIVDHTGTVEPYLRPLIGPAPERDTPEQAQQLITNFVNRVLFGANVLMRGELARALDILGGMQHYLLWMARLQEASINHWPTPSRAVERELSAAAYMRYARCTTPLDRELLWHAYSEAWSWGRQMMAAIAQRHDLALPVSLFEKLEALLQGSTPE